MACSFPTVITTVDDFLKALNMERYKNAFSDLSIDSIRGLTDEQLLQLGVAVKGHRTRILMGVETLNSGEQARIDRVATILHERNETSTELLERRNAQLVEASPTEVSSRLDRSAASYTFADPASESEYETDYPGRESESDDNKAEADDDTDRSIEVVLRRKLTRRIAVSIALLLLLVLACYAMLIDYSHRLVLVMSDKPALGKNRLWNSQVLAVAYRIGFTAVTASFWPTDAALQTGWGQRCTAVMHTATMLGWTAQIRVSWGLTDLYPLPAQTYLHKSAMTLVLLFFFHDFIHSLRGTNTWGFTRSIVAAKGSVLPLSLIGLRLLEGTPAHACYFQVCLAYETLLEAWACALWMAFSFWSVALLSTPDNRMVIARLTGLAHVPLALNDIHVSNSKHLRKEVEEGDVRRGVSWGVPIVVGQKVAAKKAED